jgi:hypothetical protein
MSETPMPRVLIMNEPTPKGNVGIIQAFFVSAVHLLFQHSPAHPNLNSELRVMYGSVGPQIRHGGSRSSGYDIDLTVANDLWDQHTFQFAHEVCHVLAGYQKAQHPNQWFEESICEAASLYVLKVLAGRGANEQGPCIDLWSNSTPYHKILDQYADNRIQAPASQFSGESLKQWYVQNSQLLRNDPYCRCLNQVVANKLFALIITTPTNWGAVEFLNHTPCRPGQDSFFDYLNNWRASSPAHHHDFIDTIRSMLV